MTEIWNCLPKPTRRKSAVNCLSQGHNRMVQVGFEPRPCRRQFQYFNHLTMLPISVFEVNLLFMQAVAFKNNFLTILKCKKNFCATKIYEIFYRARVHNRDYVKTATVITATSK